MDTAGHDLHGSTCAACGSRLRGPEPALPATDACAGCDKGNGRSCYSRRMAEERSEPLFYCPRCAREVIDPLTCGDCSALICRVCGTPLESADDLAIG